MLVIGRLTKDARIKRVNDDQQVVEFSMAENYYYKRKGDSAGTQQTTFYNVSYWINTGIAAQLKLGAVVEISGQLTARGYANMQGEPKAALNLHADLIRIHTTGSNNLAVDQQGAMQETESGALTHEPMDDLPF